MNIYYKHVSINSVYTMIIYMYILNLSLCVSVYVWVCNYITDEVRFIDKLNNRTFIIYN